MNIKSRCLVIMAALPLCFPYAEACPRQTSIVPTIEREEEARCFCASDANGTVIALDGERSFYDHRQVYSFESDVEVDEVRVDINAYLGSFLIDGTRVQVSLRNLREEARLELSFFRDGEEVDTKNLYFQIDGNGKIHSSALSEDKAKRSAGLPLSYGFASDIIEDRPSDLISTRGIGATGNVSGHFAWTDAKGNQYPLVGAKVKATIDGSWWSAETYTDSAGFYTIGYENIWYVGSGKLSVHLLLENNNVKVRDSDTYSWSTQLNTGFGSLTCGHTFTAKLDGDMGKAVMIFQGLKHFSDVAREQNGGVPISFCTVAYPAAEQDTFYLSTDSTIRIENDELGTVPSYAAWDVLGHEYGHHVHYYFEIANSPGGKHTIHKNNIDERIDDQRVPIYRAKDEGLRLAWAEGFATYWSIISQKYFPKYTWNVSTCNDSAYDSYNFSADLNSFDELHGDGDEHAVSVFLYKLQSPGTDFFDKFGIPDDDVFRLIRKTKPHRLCDFVTALYDEGADRHDLGLLLGRCNIIDNSIQLVDNFTNRSGLFQWTSSMGSIHVRYNLYDFYIERMNGQLLHKAAGISATNYYGEYRVPLSVWEKICKLPEDQYVVYYVAKEVAYSPASGGYYSRRATFPKPTERYSG